MTIVAVRYACWCGDSFSEWDERIRHAWECEVGRPYMIEDWKKKHRNARRSPRGSGGQTAGAKPSGRQGGSSW